MNTQNLQIRRQLKNDYRRENDEQSLISLQNLDSLKKIQKPIQNKKKSENTYNPYRMIRNNINKNNQTQISQEIDKQESIKFDQSQIKTDSQKKKTKKDLPNFSVSDFIEKNHEPIDKNRLIQINIQNIQQNNQKSSFDNKKNYLIFDQTNKTKTQADHNLKNVQDEPDQVRKQTVQPIQIENNSKNQKLSFLKSQQFPSMIENSSVQVNQSVKENNQFLKSNFMINLNNIIQQKSNPTNIQFSSLGQNTDSHQVSNYNSVQESVRNNKDSFIEQNLSRMSFGSDMMHILNNKKFNSNEKISTHNESEQDQVEQKNQEPKIVQLQPIDLTQFQQKDNFIQTKMQNKAQNSQKKEIFQSKDHQERQLEEELEELNQKLQRRSSKKIFSDSKSQNIYNTQPFLIQERMSSKQDSLENENEKQKDQGILSNQQNKKQQISSHKKQVQNHYKNKFESYGYKKKGLSSHNSSINTKQTQSEQDSDEEYFKKKKHNFKLNLAPFQEEEYSNEDEDDESDVSGANSQEQLIFENIRCDIENLKQKMHFHTNEDKL